MFGQQLLKTLLVTCSLLFSSFSLAETVWIDVRSVIEHTIDNIDGDVRISHTDIIEQVSQLYPDKSTDISLYCRSGGRAEKAMSALESAGYSNVRNVGSIDDARTLRSNTK